VDEFVVSKETTKANGFKWGRDAFIFLLLLQKSGPVCWWNACCSTIDVCTCADWYISTAAYLTWVLKMYLKERWDDCKIWRPFTIHW
jgi:hypothetical protein